MRYLNSKEYIKETLKRYNQQYPSNPLKIHEVNAVLQIFWDYIEEQMIEGLSVNIFGFGKFELKQKTTFKGKYSKAIRYFPRFTWSKHAIARLRYAVGDASEAEIKLVKSSREYAKALWEKRYLAKIKEGKAIGPTNIGTLFELAKERNDSSYLTIIDKMKALSDESLKEEIEYYEEYFIKKVGLPEENNSDR
jgi:nucleoid DNA-binding protein